jgi:hypothetical protein
MNIIDEENLTTENQLPLLFLCDVCVQKQLKFGMIKGVSFFTLSVH